MSMVSAPATQLPLQEIRGTLERVVYQNEETGYTVARLHVGGNPPEVTIVGNMMGVNVGERLHLQGFWVTHTQYGRQFEVNTYSVEYPATLEGIRKYLGSGMIRGIGRVTASKIVDHFKGDTLDVIDSQPERLSEIPGIGEKKAQLIASAWQEQRLVKEIMLFLQSHNVSTGLAVRIYRQYGDQSIQVVRNDPYRLSRDIFGVGFKTADKIARQIGIQADHPSRIQAGLLYALNELVNDGHCFAQKDLLLAKGQELLEVDKEICLQALEDLVRQQALVDEQGKYYLLPLFVAENNVANRISAIRDHPRDRLAVFRRLDWTALNAILDSRSAFQLTEQQKSAVRMALTEKVSILTGGPGTGKSTITRSIIELLRLQRASVLLCAPTGRAAKRLSDATGIEAKTIHRLLEYKPTARGSFVRDHANPLDADLIIVDETSMVDILLMNHLLDAIDPGSHLLLVGDSDQLPSVGPGNVLNDLIASQVLPITRLETIFRQSEDSYIVFNAHRINRGEMPVFSKESVDFFLFPEEDPQRTADRVVELVTSRIPERFGYHPLTDIQVLAPMHRGPAGVTELNNRLQAALNPPNGRSEIKFGQRSFLPNDRVMQIVNNYDLQVFNGDLGFLQGIDLEDHQISINYDNRTVIYDYTQLHELVHAYAISIHKSQGSEFPVVVIPLLKQNFMMLQRNLLYTAITRARKLVVLVGSKTAIWLATSNDRISQRNTRLAERLSARSSTRQ